MTVHMIDLLLVALKANVMKYHLVLQLDMLIEPWKDGGILKGETMVPLIKKENVME